MVLVYVGGAVFASALPPRNDGVMSSEQQTELRKLLQSKNAEDLQRANTVSGTILVQIIPRKADFLWNCNTLHSLWPDWAIFTRSLGNKLSDKSSQNILGDFLGYL